MSGEPRRWRRGLHRPLGRRSVAGVAGLLVCALQWACGSREAGFVTVAELAPRIRVSRPAATPETPRCAAIARKRQGVFVPWQGSAAVHALLPPGGALHLAATPRCGEGDGDLHVQVTTESGTYRRVVAPGWAGDLELAWGPTSGPARIEVTAVPRTPAAGGVVVTSLALGVRTPVPASSGSAVEAAAAVPRPPNILVYLVDTLRADALGCYGSPRGLTPNVDRFAGDATIFADAVAQSSWTRPAVASLFTGLRPLRHGVHDDQALGAQAVTLAEVLRGKGYRTAAWITNPNVGAQLGFDQGFESFRRLPQNAGRARDVGAAFDSWLSATAAESRPFFAYLHVMEPHSPYFPPRVFRRRFAPDVPAGTGSVAHLERLRAGAPRPEELAALRQLYDAEVAALDHSFGLLRSGLEKRRLWDDTVVVFVSDHGEAFYEHGQLEHGRDLHREVLDVPLIVRLPGHGAGRRVQRLVEQVDVFPTLLALAGVAAVPANDGLDLGPLIRSGELASPPRKAFSHLEHHGTRWQAVTTSNYRLLVRWGDRGTESWLFSRREDRDERHDLARARPLPFAALEDFRRWHLRAVSAPLAVPLPSLGDEERAELQALGYAG